MKDLSIERVVRMIDHTLLRPDALDEDIIAHIQVAKDYGFKTVCVFPSWIDLAVSEIGNTNIKIDVPIGFPFGSQTSEAKSFEAHDAIQRGAEELDMVINIAALKSKEHEYVLEDIQCVVAAAAHMNAIVKVIIETCYLDEEDKRAAARLCERAGADYVKTSTGFGPSGATVEDVRLLRESVSKEVGVKASGGIRTAEQALAMIEAGATRIGTSAGKAIIDELKARTSLGD